MDRDCGVVIVAAGSGIRMGDGAPKQFRELFGLPLFLWSAKYFDNRSEVGWIVVVGPETHHEEMRKLCAGHMIRKLRAVVTGGARRQDSVRSGVAALPPGAILAAVHDAARPFPAKAFPEAVRRARESGAAILAAPVAETLKRVADGVITGTVDREGLWAAQTPQIARRGDLLRALDSCCADGVEVTDEAAALAHIGIRVEVVASPRMNLKVTTAEDWPLAEAIAASLQKETRGI
jgi:2-C-methyl-D-erythritol 4-phosphate cytidylyltransferase